MFDLPTFSPPAPEVRVPEVAPLEPLTSGPDPLLGPLPDPEDRSPGPNVWVCRRCRWPVPKPKIYCPRCGYVKSVNDTRSTEKGVALLLLLILTGILVLLLVYLP